MNILDQFEILGVWNRDANQHGHFSDEVLCF